MTENAKKINLGIRATEQRRKELRKWANEHDTSVQEMFDYAMEVVYFSGKEVPKIERRRILPDNLDEEDERMLLAVLKTAQKGPDFKKLVKQIGQLSS